MTSDGEAPEWESMFHLFLRLQDEHGHAQITVAVDQNVCLSRFSFEIVVRCSTGCMSRAAYFMASRPTMLLVHQDPRR